MKHGTAPPNLSRHKSIPVSILDKKGEGFHRLERSNSWRYDLNVLRIIGSWQICKWNTHFLRALTDPLSSTSVLALTENLTPFPSITMNSTSLPGLITFRYVYNYLLLLIVWLMESLKWESKAPLLTGDGTCSLRRTSLFYDRWGIVLWRKMLDLLCSPGRLDFFTLGYVGKALFLSPLSWLEVTFLVTPSAYPTCGRYCTIALIELSCRISPS